MARMKRVVNRYGKITLASLGGCLVSVGAFLIVLSSLTVTNVARADECFVTSDPNQPGYFCQGIGLETYYCCPTTAGCNDGNCNTTCKTSSGCTDQTGCGNGNTGCEDCGCADADPTNGVKCECS